MICFPIRHYVLCSVVLLSFSSVFGQRFAWQDAEVLGKLIKQESSIQLLPATFALVQRAQALETGDSLTISVEESDAALHWIDGNDTVSMPVEAGRYIIQLSPSYIQLRSESNGEVRKLPRTAYKKLCEILYAYNYDFTPDNAMTAPDTRPIALFSDYLNNPFLSGLLKNFTSDGADLPVTDIDTAINSPINLLYNNSLWSNILAPEASIQAVANAYQFAPLTNAESIVASVAQTPFPASRGNWVSNAIVGASDFVAKRAQEELYITFLDRFKERLDSVPELYLLFPQSQQFFTTLDITQYKTLLPSARFAFTQDMENLGLNLPKLLTIDPYKKWDKTPEVYNLFLLYEMSSLSNRGIALDTLLPMAYHKLQERKQELRKEQNLRLAEQLVNSATLKTLQADMQAYENGLITLRKKLNIRQSAIYSGMAILAFSDPETALSAQEELPALYAKVKRLWDTIEVVPAYLSGTYNYNYLLQRASPSGFDRLFEKEPDTTQLIAAGLDLSSQWVMGTGQNPRTKLEALKTWSKAIEQVEQRMQLSILANTPSAVEDKKQKLEVLIDQDISFWKTNKASEHDIMGLEYLKQLIVKYATGENISDYDQRMSEYAAWLAKETNTQNLSPYQQSKQAPAVRMNTDFDEIDDLFKTLKIKEKAIRDTLQALELRWTSDIQKAEVNAQNLSWVLELCTYLVSLQRKSDTQWLSVQDFNDRMKDPLQRQLFLGLAYQRLSKHTSLKNTSPEGLAYIFTQTASTIGSLRDSMQAETGSKPLALFEASVSLLKIVLETPLLTDASSQSATPLSDRFEGMSELPKMGGHAMALWQNLRSRNYRFALHEAFQLYDVVYNNQLQTKKQQRIHQWMQSYGQFIADVATAQTSSDIELALEAATLPVGSSRIKREEPGNIALNAYFGGAFGREFSLDDTHVRFTPINSFSLSVPIGVSFSRQINAKKQRSMSLFIPFFDLGGVTAFRLNSQGAQLPEFTLQNIIAPGGYVFYNFGKSPFYLGAGGQLGPYNRITEDSNGNPVESTGKNARIQLTFGVDVPLFNLYNRSR